MHNLPKAGLYAITDCENLDISTLLDYTSVILANGAALLQYRNKKDTAAKKIDKAEKIQELCHTFNIPFIINDDIDLARSLGADGLHLGENDMDCRKARIILGPECIIGVSCYNDLQRAAFAVSNGASYIAFGAFFPTDSKRGTVKAEINIIREARNTFSVPVAAIGGITPQNGKQLLVAGANYLAVISGLYASKDPANAARQYARLFRQDMNQNE